MATKSSRKTSTTSAAKAAVEAKRAAAAAKAAEARVKATQATKGHASGFFNFIREQGVVGLAVGLAIGAAAGASVKSIVDNLISPLVALLTQGVDLNSLKWVIMNAGTDREIAIGWGAVLSSLITLGATALVVYLVIHGAKLDRIDKKKESK